MALLNTRRVAGGSNQGAIELIFERAACAAEQAERRHAELAGGIDGGKHIAAIAGGGNANQHITRPGKRFDLARKYGIKAEVIANGGERRAIRGERNGGQTAPCMTKAPDQFGGEMLRIGCAAAIAANENFSTRTQGGNQHLAVGLYRVFLRDKRGNRGLVLLDMLCNKGHAVFPSIRMSASLTRSIHPIQLFTT